MNKRLLYNLIGGITLCIIILTGCKGSTAEKIFSGSQKSETTARASAKKVTLLPSQDGRVFSIHPTDPAENVTYFASHAGTWGGRSGTVRSLVEFDLSTIPDNAKITSAQLYLYHHPEIKHSPETRPNMSYLQRVTRSWNAGTTNWNNQPTSTIQNRVSLKRTTSFTQNFKVNITNMVNDMRKYGNYGMMLKLAVESPYTCMYFASRNYSNSAYHPKLVVSYSIL